MTTHEAGILDTLTAAVAAAYTEQRDPIGDSDLYGEQLVTLRVTLPLDVVRDLRIRNHQLKRKEAA